MIISSPAIGGTGAIRAVFPSPDGTVLAVVSDFPVLTNPPGRTVYGQRLRHRVGLYRRGEQQPFVVFDQARYPVNHVAFHPTEPVVAIAGGRYDGGYAFEGELNLWDWRLDRSWPGIGPAPEVVRCGFDPAGERLDCTVRPWNDDWDWEHRPGGDSSRIYRLALAYDREPRHETAELDPATLLPPAEADAEDDPPEHRFAYIEQILADWFGVGRRLERGAIWDLAWLDADRLAAVHDDCLVEIHRLDDGAVTRLEGEGHGAALLRASPPIVQIASHPMRHWNDPWSRLLAIEGEGLREIGRFEGRYSFTCSSRGRVLGRLDRYRPGAGTADLLVDIAGGEARRLDLGHYDCQNSYIGIDGAPDLYLLRGSASDRVEDKWLCRLRDGGGVEPLWPVHPGGADGQARWMTGCHVQDEAGAGLVVAGRHYDSSRLLYGPGFIYRRSADRDRELWRRSLRDAASAVVHLPAAGLIVAAVLDGTLLVLDAVGGDVRREGRATIEGVPTVVYAMDVSGSSLALGTFDGRIAVIDLDAMLAVPAGDGRVELA